MTWEEKETPSAQGWQGELTWAGTEWAGAAWAGEFLLTAVEEIPSLLSSLSQRLIYN